MVSKYIEKLRVGQLKAMHEFLINTSNEKLYLTWIMAGVPDCPREDDFEFIAEDDELYNECFELFIELISQKGARNE